VKWRCDHPNTNDHTGRERRLSAAGRPTYPVKETVAGRPTHPAEEAASGRPTYLERRSAPPQDPHTQREEARRRKTHVPGQRDTLRKTHIPGEKKRAAGRPMYPAEERASGRPRYPERRSAPPEDPRYVACRAHGRGEQDLDTRLRLQSTPDVANQRQWIPHPQTTQQERLTSAQSETSPPNTEPQVRYPSKIATMPPAPRSHQNKHDFNLKRPEEKHPARKEMWEATHYKPSSKNSSTNDGPRVTIPRSRTPSHLMANKSNSDHSLPTAS
jgi:hypothetical protein